MRTFRRPDLTYTIESVSETLGEMTSNVTGIFTSSDDGSLSTITVETGEDSSLKLGATYTITLSATHNKFILHALDSSALTETITVMSHLNSVNPTHTITVVEHTALPTTSVVNIEDDLFIDGIPADISIEAERGDCLV